MIPPIMRPHEVALLLDFDGTLVPYASETRLVPKVDPRLPRLLQLLAKETMGATAIVSGRGVAEIDKLLGPLHLTISGTHGFEFRAATASPIEYDIGDGGYDRIIDGLKHLYLISSAWAEKHSGVSVERKALTLVLHFHEAPDIATVAYEFALEACKEMPDFALQAGSGVAEFRPAGSDKGRSIGRIMTRAPFSGRIPVFIGDDLADEAGFLAVNSLGGVSVRVGEGKSNALYRLQDAHEVLKYIESIVNRAKVDRMAI